MRRALTAVMMAAVLVLGGCAADDGYSDAMAQSLQTTVSTVTQASSQGDWAGAQNALADLEAQVTAALDAGEITEERADEITAAIIAVRSELEDLIAAQQPDEGNGNGKDKPGKPPKDEDDKDKPGKKD